MRPITILVLLLASVFAAEHPSARISNGPITSKIYLPGPVNGYYRGTRFDWSGAIYSLTYKGHEYFGEWQQSGDPYLHDCITGPVEEYRTNNGGLVYDETTPAGGRFLRIGAGVCERPQENNYRWTYSYRIVDPGKWTVIDHLLHNTGADHIIALLSGAIENRKTRAGVRMFTDKPLAKLQLWSPSTTICPEPYIDLELEPGQADRWSIHYEFYATQ